MSFELLYSTDGDVYRNLTGIAAYIDGFAEGLGLPELEVDPQALHGVAAALCQPDFPHVDGLEKASPFKKAANFFVWFVAQRPILTTFPTDHDRFGGDFASILNHQNVIFGYHLAVECLCGARLYKTNNTTATLDERIRVSKHFFLDFVETFSGATPNYHFKTVSLLFEQLAYKANRDASYPEVV